MNNQTSRNDFADTWLFEMPELLGSFETYDAFAYAIKDLRSSGIQPVQLDTDFFKIELNSVIYYWYEKDNRVLLGSELYIKPQGLIVSMTAKSPDIRGTPPYASDLYLRILKDTSRNLRLVSDSQLSEEGYRIWQNLFKKGAKISVYDKLNPGKSFSHFNNVDELEQYVSSDNSDFRRYQFVISESQIQIAECKSFFNTRRYRELAGLALED